MGTEDLDQTDLERWDLTVPEEWLVSDDTRPRCETNVHEDTSEIELDLETNVDVRTVDGRTPPEREPTVRDLVQTGPLRVGELLIPHRLFETGRLLPEQT